MKNENMKLMYAEPMTTISVVESEGFICASLRVIEYSVEVDEHQNMGTEDLTFNSDW